MTGKGKFQDQARLSVTDLHYTLLFSWSFVDQQHVLLNIGGLEYPASRFSVGWLLVVNRVSLSNCVGLVMLSPGN